MEQLAIIAAKTILLRVQRPQENQLKTNQPVQGKDPRALGPHAQEHRA